MVCEDLKGIGKSLIRISHVYMYTLDFFFDMISNTGLSVFFFFLWLADAGLGII